MSTPEARVPHRHAPSALVVVRGLLSWLARPAPGLAARWAHRLWLTPRGRPASTRDASGLARAERGWQTVAGRRIATYAWGAGPCVLLVHGWSGRASQFAFLGSALASAGYRALAFDAPAHGESPGGRTNIYEIEQVMGALADAAGPLHGIVAHSFGGACTALAMRRGLQAARVVCLAPPTQLLWMLQSFSRLLELPPAVVARLEARLDRDAGGDYSRLLSADMNARFLAAPALVLHDEDDEDVPWQQGAMLARAWPGARFERTHGLGHRRIVRDPGVADRIVAFLAAPESDT